MVAPHGTLDRQQPDDLGILLDEEFDCAHWRGFKITPVGAPDRISSP
jgi:hypothetical protein